MNRNLKILREIGYLILSFIFIINIYIEPKYTYKELIILISITIFIGIIIFYINLKNLKINNK
jgi:hypothetical protein